MGCSGSVTWLFSTSTSVLAPIKNPPLLPTELRRNVSSLFIPRQVIDPNTPTFLGSQPAVP